MNTVIKVENLSKQYRLGQVGTGSFSHDLNRWWYEIRGKENPYLTIGEENIRTTKSESDYIWALQNINFEVNHGDILGIIGRNGAGKSTLLKILSRTTAPTTGSVKIRGRVASLLEVGTGFHPELSGRDNIFLNGAILGMTRKEINLKFDEIVDFAAVERYIDTPVKRYSSGMYVRLAFAVAAHLDPEILIVDEVLAVGDAEFQKKCLGKMKDASAKEGRTVLFVSHNLLAVKQICISGIVLKNGTISYSGNSEAAVKNYLSETNSENKVTYRKYGIDECPGGDIIDLLEYSLLDKQNNMIDKFNLYDQVNIEIIFKVKQNGVIAIPNLHFYNQQDQCLFVIATDHSTKVNTIGIYNTTFNIREYTFNVGIFKVGMAITCYPGADVQLFINPAITFEVQESNIELRKSPYSGLIPGEFRLKMDSKTIQI
jgi:lipopolysaccharide transport system ATP-binding protein